jgi:(p)ppGpp synthase/HD superfamily hydrolase
MTFADVTGEMISRAIACAALAHRNQVDKSGEPYIFHPLRVMLLARDRGLPLAMQAAAVLHDAVEDTDCTEASLREAYPAEVVDAVMHLTRRKPAGETYDAFITRLCDAPNDVIELKLCDLDDNMSPSRTTTDKLRALVYKRYRPTRKKLEEVLAQRYGL